MSKTGLKIYSAPGSSALFAGAILAVIGMVEIVADYLKEKSR